MVFSYQTQWRICVLNEVACLLASADCTATVPWTTLATFPTHDARIIVTANVPLLDRECVSVFSTVEEIYVFPEAVRSIDQSVSLTQGANVSSLSYCTGYHTTYSYDGMVGMVLLRVFQKYQERWDSQIYV